MADGSVTINITGDAKGFDKELKDVKSKISGLSKETDNAGKAGSGFGKVMSAGCKVAAAATAAVGTAIGGIVVASTKVGMSFEAEMSKVQAISGASGTQLQQLTDKAKEMGASTKFSATESAQAMEYMAMAGWKTEDMLNGLGGIMNLAAASGEDLATTSDIVTDALTAFGLSASESTRFADVLATAASNSNTTVAGMGETFKYVAPLAGALGYSVEDTAVAIGLMANSGIKGSQAGTALRGMLTNLAKPSSQVAGYMDKLGLSLTDAAGNAKPLSALLQELRQKFAGLTDAQKTEYAAAIAGQEGMSGLLAIVNASDSDFAKLTDAINNSSGAAEDMANVMNDNLAGAVQSLKSHAETLGLAIYDSFAVQMKDAVNLASDALTKLTNGFETGGISGAFDQLAQLAQVGIQSIIRQAPAMTQAAAQMITGFASGLAQGIPSVLATALPLLTQFTASLRQNAGTLISAGLEMIVQLAQGIANSLPVLITYIPAIITNIAGIINDNAPKLLATGVEVIAILAQGIIQAIPVLIANLPAIIQAIVAVFSAYNWLQLGQMIVNGVKAGVSALGSALKSAGSSAISAFKSINWASAGKAVCNFIHNAISSAAGLIANALKTVGSRGMSAFRSINWASVGKAAINFIKSAISGAAGLVVSALKAVGTHGMNAFKSINWGSVGKQIINGIVSGIKGAASALYNALTGLAKNALNAAKSALGIHSPSRVFRDVVGKMIPAGIAVGIKRNTKTAVSAATQMARRVVSGAAISNGRLALVSGTHVAAANAATSYTTHNVYTTSSGSQYIDYHPSFKCDEPISARKQRAMQQEQARILSKAVKK